jgi:hypothetical protein
MKCGISTLFLSPLFGLALGSGCDDVELPNRVDFEVILDNTSNEEVEITVPLGSRLTEPTPGGVLLPGEVLTVDVEISNFPRINASLIRVERPRASLPPGELRDILDEAYCIYEPPAQRTPIRRVIWDGLALACIGWPTSGEP